MAQGDEATTVQQIIDAAEGSESTVFRYVPTRAGLVLLDEVMGQLEAGLQL